MLGRSQEVLLVITKTFYLNIFVLWFVLLHYYQNFIFFSPLWNQEIVWKILLPFNQFLAWLKAFQFFVLSQIISSINTLVFYVNLDLVFVSNLKTFRLFLNHPIFSVNSRYYFYKTLSFVFINSSLSGENLEGTKEGCFIFSLLGNWTKTSWTVGCIETISNKIQGFVSHNFVGLSSWHS